MKKAILLLSILMTLDCYSQTLIIQAGTSFSNLRKGYDKNMISPYGSIGIDYLKLKIINLSTSIGYVTKGGKDNIHFTDANGQELETITEKARINYITLNTEANVNFGNKKIIPFIAAGPRVDFLLSVNKNLVKDYFNSTVFGVNLGAGVKIKLPGKLKIGLRGTYLANFGSIGKNDVKDQTFIISALLGLKI